MTQCNHKTSKDFKAGDLWICSWCAKKGSWGPAWSYWGNIECKVCWEADIKWVACCDACAEKLSAKADEVG